MLLLYTISNGFKQKQDNAKKWPENYSNGQSYKTPKKNQKKK